MAVAALSPSKAIAPTLRSAAMDSQAVFWNACSAWRTPMEVILEYCAL
jgi:hypothetical protein